MWWEKKMDKEVIGSVERVVVDVDRMGKKVGGEGEG